MTEALKTLIAVVVIGQVPHELVEFPNQQFVHTRRSVFLVLSGDGCKLKLVVLDPAYCMVSVD